MGVRSTFIKSTNETIEFIVQNSVLSLDDRNEIFVAAAKEIRDMLNYGVSHTADRRVTITIKDRAI